MKKRLDELVVENQICTSINEARALIMAGKILVDNVVEDKAGMQFNTKQAVRLKATKKTKFVSRGGLKLEKAIDYFDINIDKKVCVDVGCSTGGFTDVLLRNGAFKVYAIDVGTAQLDWKLRVDNRVVVMEGVNIKNVTPSSDMKDIDFICMDVSFISVKVFPKVIYNLLKSGGEVVILVKPQFEAKRHEVGDGGIITDETIWVRVVKEVVEAYCSLGFEFLGETESPVKGAKGNKEFLVYLKRTV